jgi:hypothetical protein
MASARGTVTAIRGQLRPAGRPARVLCRRTGFVAVAAAAALVLLVGCGSDHQLTAQKGTAPQGTRTSSTAASLSPSGSPARVTSISNAHQLIAGIEAAGIHCHQVVYSQTKYSNKAQCVRKHYIIKANVYDSKKAISSFLPGYPNPDPGCSPAGVFGELWAITDIGDGTVNTKTASAKNNHMAHAIAGQLGGHVVKSLYCPGSPKHNKRLQRTYY